MLCGTSLIISTCIKNHLFIRKAVFEPLESSFQSTHNMLFEFRISKCPKIFVIKKWNAVNLLFKTFSYNVNLGLLNHFWVCKYPILSSHSSFEIITKNCYLWFIHPISTCAYTQVLKRLFSKEFSFTLHDQFMLKIIVSPTIFQVSNHSSLNSNPVLFLCQNMHSFLF